MLRLSFERRGGKKALAERYASAPFGTVRANYPDASGIPEVQITNPSGGILGGDRLEMEATVEQGCAATVLTQGASKAYRGRESIQKASVRVGEGAFLEYLPHHLIPFAGSHHRQITEFDLSENATLVFWEAFSAGRVARGERFAFDRLSARTRVTKGGHPEIVDGLDLPGGEPNEPFGGYSYLGTLTVAASRDLTDLAEKIHLALLSKPRALASASAPHRCLCVARVLTIDADALYSALNVSRKLIREFLGFPPPVRDVR